VRKPIVFLILLLFTLTILVSAQDKGKRPSPPAQTNCKFSNGKTLTIDYSSPRAKGRKIFGDLVPYGEVWRTGANEATTFVTTANLSVGGNDVPAGSYTIFTVPNADKWTLIVNKKTGEWGIPYKYEADELTRADIHVFAGRELYHCTGLDGRELRSEYQLGKHAGFSEHQREIGERTNNHKGHDGSQRKSSVSLWTFVPGACPEQSRRVVNAFRQTLNH
jgi:Protein of unknown function (DUF2911)